MLETINIILNLLQQIWNALQYIRRKREASDKWQQEARALVRAKRGKCLKQGDVPHIRSDVLKAYKVLESNLSTVANKCIYVVMYLYLTYARLLGGVECKVALQRIKERMPDCSNGRKSEECIISSYIVKRSAAREMERLAKHSNIYGKIARYMLEGIFPEDCLEDLRDFIQVIPERHRSLLNIPPP